MAIIEEFLGKSVEIPEDRRYDVKQGLWAACTDQALVFGLTQPALVLAGGVKDLDWLVAENRMVQRGESILFAITGKILYLDAPVGGNVEFNQNLRTNITLIASDPYHDGWMFLIKPHEDLNRSYETLQTPQTYLEKLRHSDGFKNPQGIKGGVSGICKAVYSGIGEQKI